MTRGGSKLFLMLFLGIFALAGVGVSAWGLRILRHASASTEWPFQVGEVVTSYVRADSDSDGTTYHAEVSYRYVVDDQVYVAGVVNFGQYGSSNRRHAQAIVNRYPVGRQVQVYYDAQNPATAVLEPGVTWSSYMVFSMGACFTVTSLFFVPILFVRRPDEV